MQYLKFVGLTLTICLLPAAALQSAGQGPGAEHTDPKEPLPLRLALVSPLKANGHSIQYQAGWPLSFKIIATGDITLVVPPVIGSPPSEWPEPGATSFVMLKDTDDCPSAGGRVTAANGEPFCADLPDDELWLEFTPDEDFPGVADSHGFAELRSAMKDPARRPTINYKSWPPYTFGPKIHETPDGLGYGANDDLPGFVLLSDTGVGRVLSDLESFDNGGAIVTAGWEEQLPLQRRNLAGLMTSVAYELNDERLSTTITTSLTIPRHLTARLYLEDQCFVSPNGGCGLARRVDGGPIGPGNGVSIYEYDVTLRAFVVQGVAPAVISDCNADGEVDAADAACMGYQLLSKEVSVTVHQIGRADVCNLLRDPWGTEAMAGWSFVDFDGNGDDLFGFSCPGGSTGGGAPPRQISGSGSTSQ